MKEKKNKKISLLGRNVNTNGNTAEWREIEKNMSSPFLFVSFSHYKKFPSARFYQSRSLGWRLQRRASPSPEAGSEHRGCTLGAAGHGRCPARCSCCLFALAPHVPAIPLFAARPQALWPAAGSFHWYIAPFRNTIYFPDLCHVM